MARAFSLCASVISRPSGEEGRCRAEIIPLSKREALRRRTTLRRIRVQPSWTRHLVCISVSHCGIFGTPESIIAARRCETGERPVRAPLQLHRASSLKDLNAAGAPCGPIYSIDQIFNDAQVLHLDIALDVPNAKRRHIRPVRQPSCCPARRARCRRGRRSSASRPTRCLASLDLSRTRSAHRNRTRL